jgi:hypothetical protein
VATPCRRSRTFRAWIPTSKRACPPRCAARDDDGDDRDRPVRRSFIERAPTLADVHGSLAAGLLSVRTRDGQWAYGQAPLAASARLT